jgi:UDP-N-acetylmuramoyl-tripeptide--D-alanyl-D-alanine ligase
MTNNMKSKLKNWLISILTLEAKLALYRHKPKIIAVTGNVGKTSTKDAIFAVLAKSKKVRKSDKSFNSEIGLPLAILNLNNAWSSPIGWLKNMVLGLKEALFGNYPEWIVLEVGADHPGDIEKVSQWLHPDIVVLTRMSDVPVHVEYFKDAAEVLREKMFLAKALKPGGTLVVNSDDEYFQESIKEIDANKVFFGSTPGANVEIKEAGAVYAGNPLPLPRGQYAVMRIGGREERIEIYGILGTHLMYPIAAACAVAQVLGLDDTAIKMAFTNFQAPKGRMKILKGMTGTAIIDDTYNSSPLACLEALKALENLSLRGKKIAALADMKELGENSKLAHKKIGQIAGGFLHTLIVVGEMAQFIAEGALEVGMAADKIYSYPNSEEAGKALAEIIRAGDVVLVKGSQSMRMEKVTKEILEDKLMAYDVLVRQEEEWLKR